MRFWVANCQSTHMVVGSTVGPNIFVKICGWAASQISRELKVQIKEEFGRLDGMYLIYYNKDNSMMNSVQVPNTYINRAYNFWYNINEEHKRGLPDFKQGVSPVQDWNCSYCPYLDHCNPPNKKRR